MPSPVSAAAFSLYCCQVSGTLTPGLFVEVGEIDDAPGVVRVRDAVAVALPETIQLPDVGNEGVAADAVPFDVLVERDEVGSELAVPLPRDVDDVIGAGLRHEVVRGVVVQVLVREGDDLDRGAGGLLELRRDQPSRLVVGARLHVEDGELLALEAPGREVRRGECRALRAGRGDRPGGDATGLDQLAAGDFRREELAGRIHGSSSFVRSAKRLSGRSTVASIVRDQAFVGSRAGIVGYPDSRSRPTCPAWRRRNPPSTSSVLPVM